MPVLLLPPGHCAAAGALAWVSVGGPATGLDPARRLSDAASRLEAAFAAVAPQWLELGHRLGLSPDAVLAHAPSCAGNISDLGLMLAWTRLVDELARGADPVAVICHDGWLFRHLATRPGVTAKGPAPAVRGAEMRLALRGLASRLKVSLRMAAAALSLRRQRRLAAVGKPAILVYGHPASTAEGRDAYFGDLMLKARGIQRVLHVDCSPPLACRLDHGGRSISLHAFGSPLFALGLWRTRWRPKAGGDWLLRRARALEGGSGQAAMIRWQIHCQERWLAAVRPPTVAWPWENHGWERAFVRACRDRGVATLGYQHSTVGTVELNHSARSNSDGLASIPDQVACVGAQAVDRLVQWGLPAERAWLAGVWRYGATPLPLPHDPQGPVFLALPAHGGIGRQMLEAARALLPSGRRFLVREHPMTPLGFTEEPGLVRTADPMEGAGPLAAVVYAATTVGVQAALAGLPVIRFLPEGLVANDVLPAGMSVAAADHSGLATALEQAKPVAGFRAEALFAPVDLSEWLRRLGAEAAQ